MIFVFYRGFCTIKRKVYKKIRRALIRASAEYTKTKSLSYSTAQKIIAYNSFLKNSSSSFPREKYSAKFLLYVARKVVGKVLSKCNFFNDDMSDFSLDDFLETFDNFEI